MNEIETIRDFSARLIETQRPLRILEAVRWTDDIRDRFLKAGGTELPRVDQPWYQGRALGFDAESMLRALAQLENDITRSLGAEHPAAAIMTRMCREYRTTVEMLTRRGSREFGLRARELFGSSADTLGVGKMSLAEFGRKIRAALKRIEPCLGMADPDDVADITGKDAAGILQQKLNRSMNCHGAHTIVVADDGIIADAAAGADKIKLREDALFSQRQLRLLEVHEGWIHVGTTLNGDAQPVCHFLSKGSASATVTQEGLAVLMEILAYTSSPKRQHRLNNRILAVEMAENGANFLEVYRFFRDQGCDESDSYQFSTRVFRGSTPEGPPFTKDLAYTKGFVMLYGFLRIAVNAGQLDLIPLLFCGKTALDDIGHLRQLSAQGLLSSPAFVPPQFADLHGLAAWMAYDAILAECCAATGVPV